MTAISAKPPLAALPPPLPVRPRGDVATVPPEGMASLPGMFETRELGMLMSALAPLMKGPDGSSGAGMVGGVLRDLANRRAAGEDLVLMVASMPGGGAMATVMSRDELAEALASDDPDSLGSVITDDGRYYSHRDIIRDGLRRVQYGLAEEAAIPMTDAIAAAIADMMAEAAGDGGATELREAGAALARGIGEAAEQEQGGVTISLVALPGAMASGPRGEPRLLDVAV